MQKELSDVKNNFVENEEKQKKIIAKIRKIQDNYKQGSDKYFTFIEEHGHGFIDGLESYWRYLHE